MFESIANSLTKYVDFGGRATRQEFWYFVLFYYASAFIGGILDGLFGVEFIGTVVVLGLIIPYISCAVRRMHDVGKSGWFILMPIYNLILFLTPTKSLY